MHGATGNFDDPWCRHGGCVGVARSLYGRAPLPWLDLSTGINPHPYPAPRAGKAQRMQLPDPAQLQQLEATAAAAFGVADPSRIAAVAGSEAALRLLPHVLRREQMMVVTPTYSSHADAWQCYGARVEPTLISDLESAAHRAAVLTLVNPNNPDGVIVPRERLLTLHDTLAAHGGMLIVDEAFVETEPGCSVADLAGSARAPQLLVLRSFGKFYGLAGLRLGFVIAAPAVIAALRALLGDWPVCADALTAGLAAYPDEQWADKMRRRLQRLARRLDRILTLRGLQVVGGTSLFRLARCADAPARFERLLQAGILVRPFKHDSTLLRFGLPYGEHAWQRLADALKELP